MSGSPAGHPLASILEALERVLPPQRPLALHEPELAGTEWDFLKSCLDSGWVSSAGEYVGRFEAAIAEYTAVPHVVATVNGTAALHVALQLAGVTAGDEVLCPALTFVATCNTIAYCGATPHFVDVESSTLGVDPDRLAAHLEAIGTIRHGELVNRETGRPLRAVVVVHALGHPARMNRIVEVSDRFGLTVVEDAAEAMGSFLDGSHLGSWGRIAVLSFNGNKIITTGGGGALLTRDPSLADRARHLTTTAKVPHPWAFEHDAVGYNYRLPNLNAALGLAQLERLESMVQRKRALAHRYQRALASIPGVSMFSEPPGARSNYWLNLLELQAPELRDQLLMATHEAQILTRPFWTPMHRLGIYRSAPSMSLPVTESLAARGVCLPSSADL